MGYSYTSECIRQWEFIESSRENTAHFENMTKMLSEQLHCENYQDFSLRGVFDLCRKSILFLPVNSSNTEYPCCVINVSVIAKYYSIYFSKFSGVPTNTLKSGPVNEAQKSMEQHISKIVKSYYPGYDPFPLKSIDEIVPEIFSSINNEQYATYFECLVTNDIF
jgi:hypothetical protein